MLHWAILLPPVRGSASYIQRRTAHGPEYEPNGMLPPGAHANKHLVRAGPGERLRRRILLRGHLVTVDVQGDAFHILFDDRLQRIVHLELRGPFRIQGVLNLLRGG